MHRAAILGFEIRSGTFCFVNPTSEEIAIAISNWELGHSDFPVQIEATIS